jgi:hypothetical protein
MKIGKFVRTLLGVESRLEKLRIRLSLLERYLKEHDNPYISHDEEVPVADPLVVPRLSGGLGNQMFQVAAAYALARKVGSRMALNYDRHFSTGQGGHPLKYKDTVFRKIPVTECWPPCIYQYHEYSYMPIYSKKHLQLDGYFQSGKYFDDYRDEVKELIEFPEATLNEARLFLGADTRPTVGIHVRLGDYLSERYRRTLNVCTPTYYRTALRRFSREPYRFILCSDDPEGARKILNRPDIETFRGSDELAEMALLSQCNNLIISNSSFSWWSCFLGVKKEQVMAPKIWFGKKSGLIDVDMFEPTWTKISTTKKFLYF